MDPSAETTNTEAAQTETVQNKETEKPADEGGFCRKIIKQRRKKMLLQNREMGKSRMISRMDPVKNSLRSQQRITIPFDLVIDRSSTSQNVYLLSQVDENDLKEFVDQEKEPATVTPTPQVVIDEIKPKKPIKNEEIAKPEK